MGCSEVLCRIAVINTMTRKTKLNRVFYSNPQGGRLRGRPKTDGCSVSKQILITAELQIGKRGKKIELTGRSQFIIIIIIIGSTALGGLWPPQTNVTSDLS